MQNPGSAEVNESFTVDPDGDRISPLNVYQMQQAESRLIAIKAVTFYGSDSATTQAHA